MPWVTWPSASLQLALCCAVGDAIGEVCPRDRLLFIFLPQLLCPGVGQWLPGPHCHNKLLMLG